MYLTGNSMVMCFSFMDRAHHFSMTANFEEMLNASKFPLKLNIA